MKLSIIYRPDAPIYRWSYLSIIYRSFHAIYRPHQVLPSMESSGNPLVFVENLPIRGRYKSTDNRPIFETKRPIRRGIIACSIDGFWTDRKGIVK